MPSSASGANGLTDKEWESLLLYSYILRRVDHSKSDSADAGVHHVHGGNTVSRRERNLFEDRGWGCDCASRDTNRTCDSGAGPKAWQVLHGMCIFRNENSNRAHRPSSAPVQRTIDRLTLFQGRHRHSQGQSMAIETDIRYGRDHHSASHGSWGAAETEDLRKGLVRGV